MLATAMAQAVNDTSQQIACRVALGITTRRCKLIPLRSTSQSMSLDHTAMAWLAFAMRAARALGACRDILPRQSILDIANDANRAESKHTPTIAIGALPSPVARRPSEGPEVLAHHYFG